MKSLEYAEYDAVKDIYRLKIPKENVVEENPEHILVEVPVFDILSIGKGSSAFHPWYGDYKKELLMQQGWKCANCGKEIPESKWSSEGRLHHDPQMGNGGIFIDVKRVTKNRVMCRSCHGEEKKGSRTRVDRPKPWVTRIYPGD